MISYLKGLLDVVAGEEAGDAVHDALPPTVVVLLQYIDGLTLLGKRRQNYKPFLCSNNSRLLANIGQWYCQGFRIFIQYQWFVICNLDGIHMIIIIINQLIVKRQLNAIHGPTIKWQNYCEKESTDLVYLESKLILFVGIVVVDGHHLLQVVLRNPVRNGRVLDT